MTLTLVDAMLSIAVIAITAALIARARSADARIARRALALVTEQRTDLAMQPPQRSLVRRIEARFAALGEQLPIFEGAPRNDLAKRLTRAGFRGPRAVSVLIGIKIVGGLIAAAAAFVGSAHTPFIERWFVMRLATTAALLMIGMMLPEFSLQAYARRRQKKIAGALPDALDLLVICTNAGHSLAASIVRIAEEMRDIAPALAQELDTTAQELRLDGDSVSVLRNLAERVDVASLRTLATTLAQSQRYGTPVTQALQVLARAERNEHMHLLEERAARLSIKITLPMMFFILPTVILIAAGPAALRLMTVFK
ncbi:type II secretion system F family protein [Trinickia acidisoli]|uniref:type II secretion system F family protein n=1 Tax=Trinickia acidisoli TaxID=2767482 RepID=UPI001A8FCBB1|nr:type II secretion system F family protein [Trinickia acidisoli]